MSDSHLTPRDREGAVVEARRHLPPAATHPDDYCAVKIRRALSAAEAVSRETWMYAGAAVPWWFVTYRRRRWEHGRDAAVVTWDWDLVKAEPGWLCGHEAVAT